MGGTSALGVLASVLVVLSFSASFPGLTVVTYKEKGKRDVLVNLVMLIGMLMRAKGGASSASWLLLGLCTTPEEGGVKASVVVGMHDNRASNDETPSAITEHRPEEETTFMLLLCNAVTLIFAVDE